MSKLKKEDLEELIDNLVGALDMCLRHSLREDCWPPADYLYVNSTLTRAKREMGWDKE